MTGNNSTKRSGYWLCAMILATCCQLAAAPVHMVEEAPVKVSRLDDGTVLIDFGKVAFGNLKWSPPQPGEGTLVWHFGEASRDGRIDRKPPGTVRYAKVDSSAKAQVIAPLPDKRNTSQPAAVLTGKEVVLPFRWVELEGWQGDFKPEFLRRQSSFLKAWDDHAASFDCSEPMLNRIWELCRYSIKATTFAGIYVDGDRERIPYEADAYLNQLSHYAVDPDKEIARDSYDWLMRRPTWPTEWAPHMVFMAHADWMHTGDAAWLKPRYEALKTKLLLERVDANGWVKSSDEHRKRTDIVDWPAKERDGYVFCEVNTVVNAFHLAAVKKMADLADAVGAAQDATAYRERYTQGAKRFHDALWMPDKACYRDGLGTDHASIHASIFPLAFGLVPQDCRNQVTGFLKSKGMACSVYVAQYLMEGLFDNGAEQAAMALMTAQGDRSWRHMVESGTTITWEAWDQKYKPNQDWNHAWGAAPANLLPRYVLGIEPLSPGWKKARITPRPGSLTHASGKVPTLLGPVSVRWNLTNGRFILDCEIPKGMTAEFSLPAQGPASTVIVDGKPLPTEVKAGRLLVPTLEAGQHRLEVNPAK